MLQLFMDTASEKAFIGLAESGRLIEFVRLPFGLQNSKHFFPVLLELLSRHSLTPKDLELIGCGVGPGSYTGIRVSAAVAQSMAYGLRLPLVGISSLTGYIPSSSGRFAAVFDAKYGGLYVQEGESDGVSIRFCKRPLVVSLEDAPKFFCGIERIVTPHLSTLQSKLSGLKIQWEEKDPSGAYFAKSVDEHFSRFEYSSKAELKLLYLRKTQAEIEKGKSITWA